MTMCTRKMWTEKLFQLIVFSVVFLCVVNAGKVRHVGVNKQGFKIMKGIGSHLGPRSINDEPTGLWPSVFNVATKAIVTVNATCGEGGREVFCRLSPSDGGGGGMTGGSRTKCGFCDNFSPDPARQHPIHYAIDDTPSHWWQSPALYYGPEYEYVTITLDLKQVYQVAYVILKAASAPRPGAWVLERSLDGETFTPWQFFATTDRDCQSRYGISATKATKHHHVTDTEVICTTAYSRLTPLENGEIHASLINGRPGANETSPELLEFIKARYVRIRLQGLRARQPQQQQQLPHDLAVTDGLQNTYHHHHHQRRVVLQDEEERNKRLYYAIKDINIGGQCVCNGHASSCRHNVASGRLECECGHHTCGANCDRCCPLFNQRQWGAGSSRDPRLCQPCNCHGHAASCHYDEDVDRQGLSMDIEGRFRGGGVCANCTAFTTGPNCASCLPGYYRPAGTAAHSDEPCFACDCDPVGSFGTCDLSAGDHTLLMCACREGYAGHRCDACAEGFRGYPGCERCPCDVRGTVMEDDCESECLCKANVDGKYCNLCKPGYFALKADNLEGCSQCYCSGITTLCESAILTTQYIETLEGWLLSDITVTHIERPYHDEGNHLLSVGNWEITGGYYWLAPDHYLGNRLPAYGSVFRYKLHWSVMRGDTSGRPTTGPNVVIIGTNGLRMGHGDDVFTGSNMTFHTPLTEHSWYHIPPNHGLTIDGHYHSEYHGEPVTRVQFLSILADIRHVLLRAKFHTDQIEGSLEEALLVMGEDAGGKETDGYSSVEQCDCPQGYIGLSCEQCAYGFVRITTPPPANTTHHHLQPSPTDTFCARCDCNGHAATCDSDTGDCSTCDHHTVGEACDRCSVGYYGDPIRAPGDENACRKCACPLELDSNNFSPNCQVDVDGVMEDGHGDVGYVCTQCPRGYTGDHCEICDDGFFGSPTEIGSSCQPCTCGGSPCDRKTGQCLGCKGNTEGWRCERCKPAHFGDPSKANCEACLCDPIGSKGQDCDAITGLCHCKDYFVGRTCDKCKVGYGNVTAKCVSCDCNLVGSKSDICDNHSGLCDCQPGVEGFHCDACQHLHYGFSETGCQSCKCNERGSAMKTCSVETGQCKCKPHYKGIRCEECEAGYYETSLGCAPCECNGTGSINGVCQTNGNCPCHDGVSGARCDRCSDGYFGFGLKGHKGCKKCDICSKVGHICDQKTGRCVCPPNTRGLNCERCKDNHWNYDPILGCKACTCSYYGSTTMQCHQSTGVCTCTVGFHGSHCDTCVDGYYSAFNVTGSGAYTCKRCNCNREGTDEAKGNCITLPGETRTDHCHCDKETGRCPCKNNVKGDRCDTCIDGTFGLSLDNPEGCTKCFCFGRTTKCIESGLTWGQIRTYASRKLTIKQDIPSTPSHHPPPPPHHTRTEIPETSGDITLTSRDLSHSPGTPLYWRLPAPFLGDRILSYGGYLRFHTQTLTSDDNSLVAPHLHQQTSSSTRPPASLVVLQGNGIELEYRLGPGGLGRQTEVRLHESMWMVNDGASHDLRKMLMLVLQHVEGILLKATDEDVFDQLVLSEVTLDTAIRLNDNPPPHAKGVELCDCPPKYNGTSCQNPSTGYYRNKNQTETSSSFINSILGVAKPCQCNRRSSKCDIENGKCLDCNHNTSGDHCEICAEGYYGNPMDYNGICEPCPCPTTTQNFAKDCQRNPRLHHTFICSCKNGYEGALCDSCSLGYYGRPQEPGGSCQPCNCNVGGSLRHSCDAITGRCSCKEEMSGDKCDQCIASRNIIKGERCTPCDECIQDLLNRIDEMSGLIQLHSNTSLKPPWHLLEEMEKRYENTSAAYDNYLNFHETAGDLVMSHDELDERYRDAIKRFRERLKAFKTQNAHNLKEGNKLNDTMDDLLKSLKATRKEIEELIKTNFNIDPEKHITTAVALEKGNKLLNEIRAIEVGLEKKPIAKRVLKKCQKIIQAINQIEQAREFHPKDVASKLNKFQDNLDDLEALLSNIHGNNTEATRWNAANEKKLKELVKLTADLNATHDKYEKDFKEIEKYNREGGKFLEGMKLGEGDLGEFGKLVERLRDLDDENKPFDVLANYTELAIAHAQQIEDDVKKYISLFDLDEKDLQAVNASKRYSEISNNIEFANRTTLTAAMELNRLLHVEPGDDSIYAQSSITLGDSSRLEKRMLHIEKTLIPNLEFSIKTMMGKLDTIKMKIWGLGINNINDTKAIDAAQRAQNRVIDSVTEVVRNVTESSEKARDIYKKVRGDIEAETKNAMWKQYQKLLNLTSVDKISNLKKQIGNAREELKNILRDDSLTNLDKIRNFKHKQNIDYPSIGLNEKLTALRAKIYNATKTLSNIKVSISGKECSRQYRILDQEPSLVTNIKITVSINQSKLDALRLTTLFYVTNYRQYLQVDLTNNTIIVYIKLKDIEKKLKHLLNENTEDHNIEISRIYGKLSITSTNADRSSIDLVEEHNSIFTLYSSNLVHIGRNKDVVTGISDCLSNLIYNGRNIGLWTYVHSTTCFGCTRNRDIDIKPFYFNGDGYSYLTDKTSQQQPAQIFIKVTVSTFDENALIFLASENPDIVETFKQATSLYLAVFLKRGRIVAEVRYYYGDPNDLDYDTDSNDDDESKNHLFAITKQRFNTGRPVQVEITKQYSKQLDNLILKVYYKTPDVNDIIEQEHSVKWEITPAQLLRTKKHVEVFFGGVTEEWRVRQQNLSAPRLWTTRGLLGSLEGRYAGLEKINEKVYFDFAGTEIYNGTLRFPNALFNGQGKLSLITPFNRKLTFALRTTQTDTDILTLTYPPSKTAPIPSYTVASISILKGCLNINNDYDNIGCANQVSITHYNLVTVDVEPMEIENSEETKGSKWKIKVWLNDEVVASKEIFTEEELVNFGLVFGGRLNGTVKDLLVDDEFTEFSMNTVADSDNVSIGRHRREAPPLDSKFPPPVAASIPFPPTNILHTNTSSTVTTSPTTMTMDEQPAACDTKLYQFERNAANFGDGGAHVSSYVRNELKKNYWRQDFVIEFEFRTFYGKGVLFAGIGQKNHFILLHIKDGKLELQIKGKRNKNIPMNRQVDDGTWHSVAIHNSYNLKKRKMIVTLDGNAEKVNRAPQNKLEGVIFIGNVPDSERYKPNTHKLHQFRGCIRNFKINNSTLSFGNTETMENVGQCFPNIENGSYFSGDAFAVYKHHPPITTTFSTSLQFRALDTNNGVLLTTATANAGTFTHRHRSATFTLQLYSGVIVASMRPAGSHSATTNVTITMTTSATSQRVASIVPSSTGSVSSCDSGHWYQVHAGFNTEMEELRLTVDGVTNTWVLQQQQPQDGDSGEYEEEEEDEDEEGVVYIGGVPDSVDQNRDKFRGCIRQVQIMEKPVDWIEMNDLHNVMLNSCPVA